MTRKLVVAFIATTIALSGGPALAKKSGAKADYRSAKSGKYVKKDYANKHKNTTVREERKKK